MHKIKNLLYDELEKFEKKGELSAGSLDTIHKLTDTIKNIDKIEMLEGSSESRGTRFIDDRSYDDDGASNARRGMHYVRGHYSRDEGEHSGGDYSREKMLNQLRRMMDEACDEETRNAIHRCMAQLDKE